MPPPEISRPGIDQGRQNWHPLVRPVEVDVDLGFDEPAQPLEDD